MGIAELATLITAIGAIVVPLLSFIRDLTKAKVAESGEKQQVTELERLTKTALMAVQASEELGKGRQWSPQEKQKYATEIILAGFPDLSKERVEAVIHSALMVASLGATAWQKLNPK